MILINMKKNLVNNQIDNIENRYIIDYILNFTNLFIIVFLFLIHKYYFGLLYFLFYYNNY